MSDVPLTLVQAFRKMAPEAVEQVLNQYNVDPAQRERYMALAGKDLATVQVNGVPPLGNVQIVVQNSDPVRNHWLATAYILGASYRMLGQMHSVTHQTIVQCVKKHLNTVELRNARLGFMLEPERISEYHTKYYENKAVLSKMPPHAAAEWLRDHTTVDALEIDNRYEEGLQ